MLKKSHLRLLLSILVSTVLLVPAASFANESRDAGGLSDAIDGLVQRYHELGRFSGVVLAARDGEEVFARGYGYADREHRVPNGPDTKLRIGSLAKQFTASAILQLEAEGKLRVEDPVVRHLPDYPRPQGEKVQIHHLLSHSSGIPSFGRRGDGLEDVEGMSEPIAMEDLLPIFAGRELFFEPGERYRYSNSAYTVAAAIVEKVSGLSFEEYLETRLFAAAGLRDSGVYDPTEVVRDLAEGYTGYEPEVERPVEEHPSWNVGAGGVYTTARDLLRWDRHLYEESVLPAAQRDKLFTHQIDWGEEGGFYGYGWWGTEVLGRRVFSHGGTSMGFVCDMYRVPSEGLTVIVLANHMPRLGANVPTTIAEQVLALLLGEEMPHPTPPDPATATAGQLALFEGEYELGEDRRLRVAAGDGALQATAEGGRPWTLFTLGGSDEVDPDSPEVRRGAAFVEALRDRRFGEIVEGLMPEWREQAGPESFQGPWDEWRGEWGDLVDFVPTAVTRGRLTSVEHLLRFERRLVALEIILDEELRYGGWWENSKIPQETVELIPAADGSFFADGFRWRRDDVRVRFRPVATGGEAFEVVVE